MGTKALTLVCACALGGLLGISTANATTWNFNVPSGALGTTQTYTADGITITAAGFTSTAALTAGSANANLFGKNLGGDESGLGLVDDPSGQGEITGTNLI